MTHEQLLLVVGAGGFGREVYTWLSQTIKDDPKYKIAGFLDDNVAKAQEELDKRRYPHEVVGTIQDYHPQGNESLVMGIFGPVAKKKCVEQLRKRGARFYTLVHPDTIIGHDVRIGEGCVICPYCVLANDSKIGNFISLNTNSTIGHDSDIGDFTSINGGVEITGEVKVGSQCFFGVGAVVINRCTIGDRTVVGAGSVVIRNVGSDITVFGNPAKTVKGI